MIKEPILISITGMDRPGITASITGMLATYGINILDIGQSVIHDALSLGMLIQIPEKVESDQAILDAIQNKINELDLNIRFVNISRESYKSWVGQQGKGQHIVTLLARRITAHHISRLTHIVAENKLNIIPRFAARVLVAAVARRRTSTL